MNWIHVFWLGVRSCKKKFFMAIIINRLLTKLVWSRWLDIGPKKKNKKQSNKLGHSPAILTHPWSIVHIYCPTLCLELKSLTQNISEYFCHLLMWSNAVTGTCFHFTFYCLNKFSWQFETCRSSFFPIRNCLFMLQRVLLGEWQQNVWWH